MSYAFPFLLSHGYCSSELANCMPPHGHTAQGFLLFLISILSSSLIQELTSIFIFSYPFTGKLWDSLPDPVLPPSYDLNFV